MIKKGGNYHIKILLSLHGVEKRISKGYCGGEKARQPEFVHVMDQGPSPRNRDSPRTRDSSRTRKTLSKGSGLVSEGMESNRNHSRSGLRKSPSSARQCQGEKGWSAIKSDTPDHSVEQEKY